MNLIIHQTFKLLISLFIDFLDRGLAVNKEVTEPRFLDAKLKSSLRKFSSCHHDLVKCYTNDHIYDTIVVFTIRLFPHSCLMIVFIARVTIADGCHKWSRNYLLFWSTRFHPQFLLEFMLLNLYFSAFCRSFYAFIALILFIFLLNRY
jgi:hypothetical protein